MKKENKNRRKMHNHTLCFKYGFICQRKRTIPKIDFQKLNLRLSIFAVNMY